jgi:hypothetical protein
MSELRRQQLVEGPLFRSPHPGNSQKQTVEHRHSLLKDGVAIYSLGCTSNLVPLTTWKLVEGTREEISIDTRRIGTFCFLGKGQSSQKE